MRTITQTRNSRFSLPTTTTLLALLCVAAFAQQKGSFKDTRDGKTYKTVKIGSLTWMAENLNHNEGSERSICYDGKESNCNKYGRLYDWETAKEVCPAGWSLPSDKEWTMLTNYVGGEGTAGIKLKAKSGWNKDNGKSGNGTDDYGFSALPGGYGYDVSDDFGNAGNYGSWWTSTVDYSIEEYGQLMYYDIGDVGRLYGISLYGADVPFPLYSVRCLENDANYYAAIRKANSGTFKDARDKKNYNTIKIGKQTWMAENLNYKAKGSKCYDNKESNCNKYGRLYNLETAMKACPKGWHLPSEGEWTTLTDYVGSPDVIKLKATSGWNDEGNGTDDYGFSALPGGIGIYSGGFSSAGDYGYWWSSTEDDEGGDYIKYMCFSDCAIYGPSDKSYLYSVRCIKD